MTTQMIICIVIFVATLVVYAINKWPMEVVSLISMMLLLFTGCLTADEALAGFSNSNVILIFSVIMVGEGLKRTALIHKIAAWITKVAGGNFRRAFIGFVILACFADIFFGSAVATFSVLYPIILVVAEENNVKTSKFVFPIVMCCIVTSVCWPAGDTLADVAKSNAFLETYGIDYVITLGQWALLRIPNAFVVALYMIFIGYNRAPDEPVVAISAELTAKTTTQLKPWQDIVGLILFVVMILGMLFADSLGLSSWMVCLGVLLIMLITGVLPIGEAYKSVRIPFSISMIFVGTLAIATALSNTGAAELLGEAMASALGGTQSTLLLSIVSFVFPFIITQFMNNRAVGNIVQPIIIMLCKALGANPLGPIVLSAAGALTAFMTPMASTSIPLAMGLGGYDQKELFRQGWPLAIILCVVNVTWACIFAPCF